MALNKDNEKNIVDSGDDSDDESEVLEESPCGRWQKRRERVAQRDVPGIDSAYLAMDTEEGVEVVWNEVYMLMDLDLKSDLIEVKRVFDTLIQLDHKNLVKFHKYWVVDNDKDRIKVVFITEYMSSGSLKQFLSRAKNKPKTDKTQKTLKAWKRWCTEILSAVSYLHSCEPSIIHGNITCDTIFIQHDGLIKIGSVAPDAITKNVKTTRQDIKKSIYYFPADCDKAEKVTTAVDVYSFGICALEMAIFEQTTFESTLISDDEILKILDSIPDKQQREFIAQCLHQNPELRPTARELLFNKALVEVHPLKLLAANIIVRMKIKIDEEMWKRDPNFVIAEWNAPGMNQLKKWCVSDSPDMKLDKYLDDISSSIYPTASTETVQLTVNRVISPVKEVVKSESPEIVPDIENRSCTVVLCEIKLIDSTLKVDEKPDSDKYQLHLVLKMDDKTNRDLQGEITKDDNAIALVKELIDFGFINFTDEEKILGCVQDVINKEIIAALI